MRDWSALLTASELADCATVAVDFNIHVETDIQRLTQAAAGERLRLAGVKLAQLSPSRQAELIGSFKTTIESELPKS